MLNLYNNLPSIDLHGLDRDYARILINEFVSDNYKMKKDNCIFCKIVAGEIPSRKLYEDDKFIVILDLGPAARGHALVIPKEHYDDLYAQLKTGYWIFEKEQ